MGKQKLDFAGKIHQNPPHFRRWHDDLPGFFRESGGVSQT
jgi:hypothetical protein